MISDRLAAATTVRPGDRVSAALSYEGTVVSVSRHGFILNLGDGQRAYVVTSFDPWQVQHLPNPNGAP